MQSALVRGYLSCRKHEELSGNVYVSDIIPKSMSILTANRMENLEQKHHHDYIAKKRKVEGNKRARLGDLTPQTHAWHFASHICRVIHYYH